MHVGLDFFEFNLPPFEESRGEKEKQMGKNVFRKPPPEDSLDEKDRAFIELTKEYCEKINVRFDFDSALAMLRVIQSVNPDRSGEKSII